MARIVPYLILAVTLFMAACTSSPPDFRHALVTAENGAHIHVTCIVIFGVMCF